MKGYQEDGSPAVTPRRALIDEIEALPVRDAFGRVTAVQGLLVEVESLLSRVGVGARFIIRAASGRNVACEVVGFRGERALCLPFAPREGVRKGCPAWIAATEPTVKPSEAWLGRVVNALGEPIDGKGPLPLGPSPQALKAPPPPAHARSRVGAPIDLGVRALNAFVTCCRGQRLGIFAGSGVGKSVLLSMLARNTESDVAVIGLVGERGREVQEFLVEDLGQEGLDRSVVVVATSDEPALMRRQAAYLTLAIAEHFRDRGLHALVLMDSLTRFAQAQREIGLAVGEPPTTRGYTPTVFTELPRLLERAGPGVGEGAITGLFTVLVEGDDHNEPVADAVRAIVDGHVVMERSIAERGRYPAINVLKSVSRTMPRAVPEPRRPLIARARRMMSLYADMEELIRLGAYRKGSDPDVDEAIRLQPAFDALLAQDKAESTGLEESYVRLERIVAGGDGQ